MARIRSKKYDGVYFNELASGDKSYYITYKDLDDKKTWVKVGMHSAGIREAYCKQKRDEILNKQRLGEEPPAVLTRKKSNVLKYSDVWYKYIENKAMVEARRKDFQGRYARYIGPMLGDKAATSLNKDDLKKFRDEVDAVSMATHKGDKRRPLSEKSKDMMITAIGSSYNYWNTMVEDERDKLVNPVPALRADDRQHVHKKEIKKRDIKRQRFLNREEVAMLKGAVKEMPMVYMFVVASLSTGARLSTVIGIQKTHIDLESRTVTLINTKDAGETYRGFINDEWYELLKERLPKLKPYEYVIGTGSSPTDGPITDRMIQRPLQRVLNNLFNQGLDDKDSANRVVIHTLRHTFASHLAIAGTPIYTIQKLLDHKDIATTLRYAKLAPDAGADAVRGLEL